MFNFLKNVATAAGKLARSLTSLAETIDQVNEGLRAQVGLTRAEKARKGLEHKAAGKPAPQADTPGAA